MANDKNNIFPRLWVLLSILTLVGFLGYWNYSNYHSAKNQLGQNLSAQLQLAYSEVMDSVVIEEIVIMAKVNDLDINLSTNLINIDGSSKKILPDSIHSQLRFVDLKNNPSFRDSFRIITYSDELNKEADQKMKRDSFLHISINSDSTHFSEGDIAQTDQISMVIENMFTAKEDHKPQIESQFKSKIESLGYPSHFVSLDSVNNTSLLVQYIGDRKFDKEITLGMLNYESYLWKSISPSLIFSILLLSIVGIAFWSLLSNWTKQQKLIEIKNEFISNMTHELKTPISTVGVALEAIAGFDLSEEEEKTKEYVNISRHELNRLSLLVDKVLKMASYEGSSEVMKKESINLADTAEGILRSMRLHLEEKGATANYSNTTTQSNIIGDQVHITNVIYNIIDNAMKYSDESPIVDIELSENDKNVILQISDKGHGISSDYLDKIFDRFFRVPTSDRHNVKGHGLGLSYVKDVIIKHNGNIEAKSTIGKGTTFIITLPKASAHV